MGAPLQYLQKRDLLFGPKSTPAALSAAGREYFAREAYSDALDFFEKARDLEGLKTVKAVALERGDSFLLARLERYDSALVSQQEWEQTARAAEKRGVMSMAAVARRRLAPPAPDAAPPHPAPGERPLDEA